MQHLAPNERSGLPARRATIIAMAGFNRPGSQPPRRRGLFGNRSESRTPIRRVASTAPTRAAVSYRDERRSGNGASGGFMHQIATGAYRLIGISALLLMLAAALIAGRTVLSLGDTGPSNVPGSLVPSAAPGVPLLLQPDPSTVAAETISLEGSLPNDLLGLSNATLRIKVQTSDGSIITGAEVDLPKTPAFHVSDVPLASGDNTFTAVVVVNGEEKHPSNSVTVTRDTVAPAVVIASPGPGELINGAEVVVRGKTESGVDVLVRNETSGISSSGKANGSGQYGISISLRNGINVISVLATDAVGNSTRASVEITTNAAVGKVTLVANPGTIFLNKSPKSFRITATATDSTGASVYDAKVCITITAPGLSPISLPCVLSDSNGRATGDYTFPDNYATEGRGLILVTYTLTQGDPLEATTEFTVMKKP